MYHERLVAQAQSRIEAAYKSALPQGLLRHPVALCLSMAKRLDGAVDPSGNPTRSLTPEEDAFIANERLLTKIDFRYWAERYCNPPEAPIWMGDLSFKPLGEVQVGDTVIGWERRPPKPGRDPKFQREHLVRTVVRAIRRKHAPIVKVTLASGRTLRCTADHQWSNGKSLQRVGKGRPYRTQNGAVKYYTYPWVTAKVGGALSRVIDPVDPPKDLRAAGWLGGMYDGEGGSCVIAQSVRVNPGTHRQIGEVARSLGLGVHPLGDGMGWNLNGGRQGYLKFLLTTQPVRRQWLEQHILTTRFRDRDDIVAVEPDGFGEVIGMETDTGNYVVWGYASKNCKIRGDRGLQPIYPFFEPQEIILGRLAQLQLERHESGHPDGLMANILKARQEGASTLCQSLLAHRVTTHTHVNALTASDVPENSGSEGIFGKFELIIDHLPWYLRPATKFHKKDTHWVFANGSWMNVESGKSMKGGLQDQGATKGNLGRSRTYTVLHLCLAPETLIQVAHGILKPICAVTSQDWVVTHTGVLAPVKGCQQSRRRGELGVSLWMWGTFAPLTVTRDHPVWTPTGFRQAGDLVSGDWVRRAVRPLTHTVRTMVTFPRQGGRPSQQRYVPETRALDRALGYACGLYLAEGTLIYRTDPLQDGAAKRPLGILLSCDLDEAPAFGAALRAVVGDHPVYTRRQSARSRTCTLTVSEAGLARWLYREFGEKDGKHIPDWAWTAGREFCTGLLAGYVDGDGHYAKDTNDITVVSVRAQLLVQLRDLIASLGFGWSGVYYKNPGVYFERNCRASWRLFAAGGTGRRIREALGYPTFPAASPKHWQYANNQHDMDVEVETVGDVYCPAFWSIEVDHPDHTFTTAQCAVSNTELSTWERPEQIDDGLLPAVPRSPRTLGLKESTAKGRHNWHHEDWLEAVRGNGHGAVGGRFIAIFLPWYALAKNWLPAPLDWLPDPNTVAHAQKAEREGPKWLGRTVTLSKDQLYWYEQTRGDFQRKGALSKFLEEQAADPEECFQHSGRSIFGIEALQYLDHLAKPMIDCWSIHVARDLAEIKLADLERIRLAKSLAAAILEAPQAPLEAYPSAGPVVDPVEVGR